MHGEHWTGLQPTGAVPVLRPISDAEYAAWLDVVVPDYAKDKVASGEWPEQTAMELSRQAYAQLLPEGRHTQDSHLFTVTDSANQSVGVLWFVSTERAGQRIAYVYDIHIFPAYRRRGHALRAFRAMEQEAARLQLTGIALHVFGHNHAARALYAKLGYEITDINMFKPVGSVS